MSINVQPGERAVTSFVNSTPTSQLIPSFGNCIESAKALVQMTGLPLEVARYLALNDIPCYAVVDPYQKTVCQIMTLFHGILCSGAQTPFFLSSETLQNVVKRLDCRPKLLGYFYQERLRQECEMLLPAPIFESSPLEDLARSFQVLRVNRVYFQCDLLNVALLLCAMFRLVRLDYRLAFASWIPLIAAVQSYTAEEMSAAMAQAIQQMFYNLQVQDLSIEELVHFTSCK